MASTAKYTRAPTEDPDVHHLYTQPPPSYQASTSYPATSSSAQDDIHLYGAPRSSLDNLPDDFKYGSCVADATIEIRTQFVRKVYTILTAQLVTTGAISAFSFASEGYKGWIQSHPGMLYFSMFGAIGMLLVTFWKRHSYPTNLIFLSIFTIMEAYGISVVVSYYDTAVVLNAVLLTAGIFIGLTLFACQTKYDFTSWMPYLFFALWGLILVSLSAAILPYSSGFDLFLAIMTAVLFTAYIVVDTQLVMRHLHVEEEIAAAINLYLDILNLFLAILRILNNRDD